MVNETGGVPSVYWFCYGIDPLLKYLEKRLRGVSIYSTPVYGPVLWNSPPLPPIKETFKLLGYVDDVINLTDYIVINSPG